MGQGPQGGVWVATDAATPTPVGQPVYDFGFISGLERLIVEGEQGWRSLFEAMSLQPFEVVYEDLVTPEGYGAVLDGVARHLGVEPADVPIPPPRSRRQADHVNDEWRQRYLDDLVEQRSDNHGDNHGSPDAS